MVVYYTPPTVSGGCPPVTLSCEPPGGALFAFGWTTINCTVTDSCGQSNSCSFTVRVKHPDLSVPIPGTTTVTTTDPSGAVVTYPSPTVSGGCPPITITCVPRSGSKFPIGQTLIHCDVTDAVGQQGGCGFYVIVKFVVPTLSEWGLIIMGLLLLTVGTIAIRKYQTTLAPAGTPMPAGFTSGQLFAGSVFFRVLAAVMALGFVSVAAAIWWFGTIRASDLMGVLLCAGIVAYWLHLLILWRDGSQGKRE